MAISEISDAPASPIDEQDAGPARAPLASVVVIADHGWWGAPAASMFEDNGIRARLDPTGASLADLDEPISDAAIVDMGLRARPAPEVYAAWRSRSRGALLAVAARDTDEATVLAAYTAGVDLVAPVDIGPRQLVARLRSLWRRLGMAVVTTPVPRPVFDAVQLDPDALVAVINGEKVELTRAEYDFLQLLIERDGRVVQRTALGMSNSAIDFFVRRLREKLERVDGSRRILAVRGVGFRLDLTEPATVDLRTGDDLLLGGAPA